jgi:hypothetical protein
MLTTPFLLAAVRLGRLGEDKRVGLQAFGAFAKVGFGHGVLQAFEKFSYLVGIGSKGVVSCF